MLCTPCLLPIPHPPMLTSLTSIGASVSQSYATSDPIGRLNRNMSGNQESQMRGPPLPYHMPPYIFFREVSGMTPDQFVNVMASRGAEDKIREQYIEKIPTTSNQPMGNCSSRENREKNQQPLISLLDKNRVKLPNNAYIHASWVDSFEKHNAYICTQAPMDNTVDDFWMMIMHHKVKRIITSITTSEWINICIYWPVSENSHMSRGDFRIQNTKVKEKKGTYRKTKLTVRQHSTGKVLSVTHYCFHLWPEQGIPENPISFMEFLGDVRKGTKNTHDPILVHDTGRGIDCAAVILTLDICTRRLLGQGMFDIFKTVKLLRTQRFGAIATPSEYIFLHRAMLFHIHMIFHVPDPTSHTEGEALILERVGPAGQGDEVELYRQRRMATARLERRANPQLRPANYIPPPQQRERFNQVLIELDQRFTRGRSHGARTSGRGVQHRPREMSAGAGVSMADLAREIRESTEHSRRQNEYV